MVSGRDSNPARTCSLQQAQFGIICSSASQRHRRARPARKRVRLYVVLFGVHGSSDGCALCNHMTPYREIRLPRTDRHANNLASFRASMHFPGPTRLIFHRFKSAFTRVTARSERDRLGYFEVMHGRSGLASFQQR